jgi:hypothetical protein
MQDANDPKTPQGAVNLIGKSILGNKPTQLISYLPESEKSLYNNPEQVFRYLLGRVESEVKGFKRPTEVAPALSRREVAMGTLSYLGPEKQLLTFQIIAKDDEEKVIAQNLVATILLSIAMKGSSERSVQESWASAKTWLEANRKELETNGIKMVRITRPDGEKTVTLDELTALCKKLSAAGKKTSSR